MARLHEIQVDPEGPTFSKAHNKQENVWPQQFPDAAPTDVLKTYPAKGAEITAWEQGVKMARDKAEAVGMLPTSFTEGEEDETDPDQS